MYDLKIINGTVLNFETNKGENCNIGIKEGVISCIGACPESAKKEIDAEGKIVSPGFIDIHMHEEVLDYAKAHDSYDISNSMVLMGVTTCVAGNCGNNRQSLEDFIGFIQKYGAPVNYLSFIGHNYLRNEVGSADRYKKSSKPQISQMQKIVIDSLSRGAVGISFGLEYSPGVDLEEVLSLCNVVEDKNLLLSAHYRKDAKHAIDSLNELVDISKLSGFPMQISHLGSCSAYGQMKEALELIQNAITQGHDISADCYPYDAFSTYIGSAVFDEGCFELWNKSYDSILLTEAPYKGIRCNQELFYKVREEHPNLLAVAFVMNENEVVEALKSPFVMVASDGLFRDGQGHPRAAGSFPRVLGKLVREDQELSLIAAIKKMTIMPAKRLGLNSKGVIKEGYDADIVIFDPLTIIDTATYEAPKNTPIGIDYVIINGTIAVENNSIVNGTIGMYIPSRL
ncbi:N-acyl-D-amino-acid deacylase family protein [Alkaliphilus peptidifermentans]|uniref:N-acyl-D-amino-acid deacylase n=1 Tax=Alkaliphilus peptidifermentans DSM 18978 TaxID=1120976 RepID=A0A1G5KAA5_9FIRM|nr:amidohydrolase family protein [Alkaliphilus peptidifermentans]SCY97573.1 N-acyl-D-amino-acid deacylase [Alkaliphilus peptidifermentans DSM 18978]